MIYGLYLSAAGAQAQEVAALVAEYGGLDYARRRARVYADRALELLGAALVGDDWDDSVDDDDDNDGFSDVIEVYLGTEPLDNCPDWPPGPGGDAWPLDMNMSGFINLGGDVAAYIGNMGCIVAADPTCQRIDLDMSGFINLGGDVSKYIGNMGSTCN